MEHEGLIGADIHQVGQVPLRLGRIDHRVAVVIEKTEPTVQAHVNGGGLNHLRVKRVQHHAAGLEFGADVTVGK